MMKLDHLTAQRDALWVFAIKRRKTENKADGVELWLVMKFYLEK